MTTREIVELGLILASVALATVGAIVVQPVVIGVGVLAAGSASVMRFNDRRSAITAAKIISAASMASTLR